MNDWRSLAECLGLTSLFFADDSGGVKRALGVCAQCPVLADCQADTIATDRAVPVHMIFGVRGGMSAAERRRVQQHDVEHRTVRPTNARCGTDSGYHRHRRLNEPPCPACKAAHSAAQVARDARRSTALGLRAVS